MDIVANKRLFTEIFNNNISREGSQALLEYLDKSDFFVAPASSRFHSNTEGGLCRHSINVYERLKDREEYPEEYLVALKQGRKGMRLRDLLRWKK